MAKIKQLASQATQVDARRTDIDLEGQQRKKREGWIVMLSTLGQTIAP
jgi:hypothetical protein